MKTFELLFIPTLTCVTRKCLWYRDRGIIIGTPERLDRGTLRGFRFHRFTISYDARMRCSERQREELRALMQLQCTDDALHFEL